MGATISGAVHRYGCCATCRHGWPEAALSSCTGNASASTVSLARGMRDRSGLEARIDVGRLADFLLVGKGTTNNVATRFVAYARVAMPIHAIDLVLACSGQATSSPSCSAVARTHPRASSRQLPRLKWPSSDIVFA